MRVRYNRAHAALSRAQEEVMLLHEEFRRTSRAYQKLHQAWLTLGEQASHRGRRAYDFRKAAVYHAMWERCDTIYKQYEEVQPLPSPLPVSEK